MKKICQMAAVVIISTISFACAATTDIAEISVKPVHTDIFTYGPAFKVCDRRDNDRWCTLYFNKNRVWAIEVTGYLGFIRILDPTSLGGGKRHIGYWKYYQEMLLAGLRGHFKTEGGLTDVLADEDDSGQAGAELLKGYEAVVYTCIQAGGVEKVKDLPPKEKVFFDVLKALSESNWAPGYYDARGFQPEMRCI